MKIRHTIVPTLTAALICGCATVPAADERIDQSVGKQVQLPQRTAAPVASLSPIADVVPDATGVWRSNGYGYLADLSGKEPAYYSVFGSACQPFHADEEGIFPALELALISDDRQLLTVGASVEPHVYEFNRLPALPESCSARPDTGLANTFESFAQQMQTHYVFFDRYDVDWQDRVLAARAKLAGIETETQLFDLFVNMLTGIEDGHLELRAEIDGDEREYDPGEATAYRKAIARGASEGLSLGEAKRAFDRAVFSEGIQANILHGEGAVAGERFIRYGLAAPDVGYIATYVSAGFSSRDFDDPIGDLAVLEDALDDALTEFEKAGVKAVIFDASMNHGGHDFISRAMASRFAAEPRSAYSKFAGDADKPYRTDISVVPSDRKRFTGPVYLLTSNITVSAGEILTLSMRALPNVTHVGAPTRGALSDILEKRLPNGWVLAMSNEVYVAPDGKSWEGRGIAPEVPIAVFDGDDPAKSHLEAVRTIVAIARNANP